MWIKQNKINNDCISIILQDEHKELDKVCLDFRASTDLSDIAREVAKLSTEQNLRPGGIVFKADNSIKGIKEIEKKMEELIKEGFKVVGFYSNKYNNWNIIATTEQHKLFESYCEKEGLSTDLEKKLENTNKIHTYAIVIAPLLEIECMPDMGLNSSIFHYYFPGDIPLVLIGCSLKAESPDAFNFIDEQFGYPISLRLDRSITMVDCNLEQIYALHIENSCVEIHKNCKFMSENVLFVKDSHDKKNNGCMVKLIDQDNAIGLSSPWIVHDDEYDLYDDYDLYNVYLKATYDDKHRLKDIKYINKYEDFESFAYDLKEDEDSKVTMDGIELRDRILNREWRELF